MATNQGKALSDGRAVARIERSDGESLEDHLKKIRNSGRGYKARFTIAIRSGDRLAKAVGKVPTPAGVSQIQASIREIGDCLNPIKDRLQELMEASDDKDEVEDAEGQLTDYQERADELRIYLAEIIHKAKLPKQFNVNEPSDDEESEEEDEKKGRAKPDTALKPDKLTTDFTPDEFREWREQWYSYFEASNFEAVSERCQQQYLKACLNTNLKLRLSEKCNKDTPIFGADDSCMAYLQQEFDAQYPLQNRRLEFFHYKQRLTQKNYLYIVT